jgi:predicted ATP-grasp superfamily ATP-dependent carboligase
MNILLYEHITAALCRNPNVPVSLVREGQLMIHALVRLFDGLKEHEVRVVLDERLADEDFPLPVLRVHDGALPETMLQEGLDWADAVLVVAPESDGLLEGLTRQALDSGVRILGSTPAAIGHASSKRRFGRTLQGAGIAVVSSCLPGVDEPPLERGGRWVVKPDRGCGCEGQRVFETFDAAWGHALSQGSHAIVQPWVEGEAMSASLLCRNGQTEVISINRQEVDLDKEGKPRLMGLRVNARPILPQHRQWAEDIVRCVPGLDGLVGVDWVDSPAGAVVLELNPRPTTACCGWLGALGWNPVHSWLGGAPAERWQGEPGHSAHITITDG